MLFSNSTMPKFVRKALITTYSGNHSFLTSEEKCSILLQITWLTRANEALSSVNVNSRRENMLLFYITKCCRILACCKKPCMIKFRLLPNMHHTITVLAAMNYSEMSNNNSLDQGYSKQVHIQTSIVCDGH